MLINVPLAGVDRRAVDTCTVNADSFLSGGINPQDIWVYPMYSQ